MKKKIDVIKAIQTIREECSALIKVRHVEILFDINEEKEITIRTTIFYTFKDVDSNFTVTLYSRDIQSLENIIFECKKEIYSINPKTITEFTAKL